MTHNSLLSCVSPKSFPVVIGAGSHPFPFRTRKLSLLPPMVLCGKSIPIASASEADVAAAHALMAAHDLECPEHPLVRRLATARAGLERIAGDVRRDGGWNISKEADIARETLAAIAPKETTA